MTQLLTAKQMRDSDARAIGGNEEKSRELMYLASLGVYNNVKWYGKIGIVVGKGNNGGDGYSLALILKENNLDCDIIAPLGEPKKESTAYYYFNKCKDVILILKSADLNKYDVLVDCIFGTGFDGKIEGELKELFSSYNKSRGYKVSVDINSGLSSDTGLGENVLLSDITVSIGSYKLGHVLNMANDAMKSKINVDIGIEPIDSVACLFEEQDAGALLKDRQSYSYKGTYGTVTLIGGMDEYTGAIKLANMSALAIRSGCGICRLAVPETIKDAVMPYLLDSTLYKLSSENGSIKYNEEQLDYLMKNSTVISYGMGTVENADSVSIIKYILKNYKGILILDAGGLRSLAKIDLEEIIKRKCQLVLTPHLGEMRALYSDYRNPLDVVDYARRINSVVLLKGNATIITDGENTLISDTGCPGMAKGGSGDVLSGIIAGLVASRKEDTRLVDIVALGAYINGIAGEIAKEELCDISMCASDTAKSVGKAIKKIKNNQ